MVGYHAGVRFPALLFMDKNRGLVLGVVAVLVVGAGSASVLDGFGSISGTADVEPAIKIVEVDYESVSGVEYVKLKNPSNAEVTLTDWGISDQAQDGKDTIESLIIPAEGGTALIVEDSANIEDSNVPNYETVDDIGAGLANDGDKVLLSTGSLEIDSVEYDSSTCSDGQILEIDWETGEKTCDDTDYDFSGGEQQ